MRPRNWYAAWFEWSDKHRLLGPLPGLFALTVLFTALGILAGHPLRTSAAISGGAVFLLGYPVSLFTRGGKQEAARALAASWSDWPDARIDQLLNPPYRERGDSRTPPGNPGT